MIAMCCFSQPVKFVSNTSIFARGDGNRQYLVYSMTYAAAGDLAMVLPLPVPPNPPEDAVRFVNLERYPEFFDDMRKAFMRMQTVSFGGGAPVRLDRPTLRVHDVGEFEASFVPRLEEFDRLDERFRIARNVWDLLPTYRDYGFAVFKLKGTTSSRRVHPMAFSFPRRNEELLFFPTVHIHDQEVHVRALFDHELYFQTDVEPTQAGLQAAYQPAGAHMDIERAGGIVAADSPCWQLILERYLENRDTWVGEGGHIPSDGLKAEAEEREKERLRRLSIVMSVPFDSIDGRDWTTCPGCDIRFGVREEYREGDGVWRHSCGQPFRRL